MTSEVWNLWQTQETEEVSGRELPIMQLSVIINKSYDESKEQKEEGL